MDAELDTEFVKSFIKNNFVKPTNKSALLKKALSGLPHLENGFTQQFEKLVINGSGNPEI